MKGKEVEVSEACYGVERSESLDYTDRVSASSEKPTTAASSGFTLLFKYTTRSDLPILLLAIFTICASSAAVPLQTYLYGKVFEDLSKFYMGSYSSHRLFMDDVRYLAGMIMVVGLCQMLIRWSGIYCWYIFGERQQLRVRKRLFNKMLFETELQWYDRQQNLMGTLGQVNRSIEELRVGTANVLGLLVESTAAALGLFVMAMFQSWSLTLVVLATIPLSALSSLIFGGLTQRAADSENDASSRCSKILDWNFANNRTIKVFNAKLLELVKFNKVVDESARAHFKLANAVALNGGFMKMLTLLMFVQGFWFGNYMISRGHLSINQVFTCFTSCLALGSRIGTVSSLMVMLNKSYAAIERVANFMDENDSAAAATSAAPAAKLQHQYASRGISPHARSGAPPLRSQIAGIHPLAQCTGQISMQNVSFTYTGRQTRQALRDVSVSFRKQEFNFVIGKSGSGKSTLAQLLMDFYKPDGAGRIEIDGYNLETLSKSWVCENVTYLQQTPAIFNESLEVNLSIGLGNVDQSILDEAMQFACLQDMEMKDGFSTIMNPSKLSGGQKQRIALARAYIRNTEVLILDEALSAIDIKTRTQILQAIRHWRRNKTTIVITHDLEQIQPEDFVIWMESGAVKYQGILKDIELGEWSISVSDAKESTPSAAYSDSDEKTEPKSTGPAYITDPAILRDLEINAPVAPGKDSKSAWYILQYCKKSIDEKLLLALGLAVSIFGSVLSPVFSFCFSKLLSNMVSVSTGVDLLRELAIWSGIIVGIAVLSGACDYLSHFILAYISEKWIVNLRKETFAKITEQEASWHDQESTPKPSELTALIMNDTRDLRSLVSEAVSLGINVSVMSLVGIVWAIVSGWKLALVGISFVPATLLVTGMFSRILQRSEHWYKDTIVEVESHLHDVVSNKRSILSLNVNSYFSDKLHTKMSQVRRVGHLRAIYTGLALAISGLLTSLATGAILYYGMQLTSSKEYTQQQMLLVITLLTFTMANVSSLLNQIPDISRGRRAGTYIIELLKLPPSPLEMNSIEKPFTRPSKKCSILSIQKANFVYGSSPNKSVLKDLDFSAQSGETIAIVGPSGSGKSTIAALLERLYKVKDGEILLNGSNLYELDIEWVRKFVGFVPQHPSFFEGTVLENLTYGLRDDEYTQEDVHLALKRANIFAFVVSLENGLHTCMGEGSNSLMSGGQLQRLSIARALIRKPKLLIMDECTSALDQENSRAIHNLVANELNDGVLTTLVITHSAEMMRCCQRVCLLQDGSIREEGPFEVLHNQRQELYKLVHAEL